MKHTTSTTPLATKFTTEDILRSFDSHRLFTVRLDGDRIVGDASRETATHRIVLVWSGRVVKSAHLRLIAR